MKNAYIGKSASLMLSTSYLFLSLVCCFSSSCSPLWLLSSRGRTCVPEGESSAKAGHAFPVAVVLVLNLFGAW